MIVVETRCGDSSVEGRVARGDCERDGARLSCALVQLLVPRLHLVRLGGLDKILSVRAVEFHGHSTTKRARNRRRGVRVGRVRGRNECDRENMVNVLEN